MRREKVWIWVPFFWGLGYRLALLFFWWNRASREMLLRCIITKVRSYADPEIHFVSRCRQHSFEVHSILSILLSDAGQVTGRGQKGTCYYITRAKTRLIGCCLRFSSTPVRNKEVQPDPSPPWPLETPFLQQHAPRLHSTRTTPSLPVIPPMRICATV